MGSKLGTGHCGLQVSVVLLLLELIQREDISLTEDLEVMRVRVIMMIDPRCSDYHTSFQHLLKA